MEQNKIFEFNQDIVKYVGYSERGLISILMFKYIVNAERALNFLSKIKTAEGKQVIDDSEEIKEIEVFSELDFGKRDGFGCPDGMLVVKTAKERNMTFIIEAKLKDYKSACEFENGRYNSSIRGQIELRWRAVNAFNYNPKAKEIVETVENARFFKGSESNKNEPADIFYQEKNNEGKKRKLEDKDVVKIFKKYLNEKNNEVYYLCITREKNKMNPFINQNKNLLPRKLKKANLCWIDVEEIRKLFNE